MSVATAPRLLDAARDTLGRAVDHLLSLQQPDGHWKGELETNVTIDAEDVFLRHYLQVLDAVETTKRSATSSAWRRSAPIGRRSYARSVRSRMCGGRGSPVRSSGISKSTAVRGCSAVTIWSATTVCRAQQPKA